MIKEKNEALELVKQNGLALENVSSRLRKDKEVMMEAVKQNGLALKYAPSEFIFDREIVLEAVKQNGFALQYASENLRNDDEIVLAATKQKKNAMIYSTLAANHMASEESFLHKPNDEQEAAKSAALQYASGLVESSDYDNGSFEDVKVFSAEKNIDLDKVYDEVMEKENSAVSNQYINTDGFYEKDYDDSEYNLDDYDELPSKKFYGRH